ncbi:MAG: anaerobic glycerol-3-phosphate dehydrogenase subunit B [Gracilibacteraceae bacterium]|nr:anaerobic glycerol-3-phosphate dehydrogenase subunit B [Gracilibacteraceae bacterium]
MKYDLVVIGSGMSGLMAAAKAVQTGKSALIVTKGQGALSLTSGCVDFWGYRLDAPKAVAPDPGREIKELARRRPEHPYAKVEPILSESVDFFLAIMREARYEFTGGLGANQRVLTSLGTRHIAALAPRSMVLTEPEKARRVVAVGFKNYGDFFPAMFLDNSARFFPRAERETVMIDLGINMAARSGYLSLLLEQEAVQAKIARTLRGREGDVYVFPAVLGSKPDSAVWRNISAALAAQVIEVPGLPPSIPGSRLYNALKMYLRRRGTEIRSNMEIIGADLEAGRVRALRARDSSGAASRIEAGGVVLATGSFFGGGLEAGKERLREPIFDLPVYCPEWPAEQSFLSPAGQPFLAAGLEVDGDLRPCAEIANLYAAGNVLAHADYAAEKSGLGLAVATGYKAGGAAAAA